MKRRCVRCDRACKELQGTQRRVCDRCQTKQRRATARRNHVARTYGLTPDDYTRLLEHQDGKCAICQGERPYNLAVDHCHQSQLVRGLLCKRCNKLLRDVRDDRMTLWSAGVYLKHPPAAELGIEARGDVESGDNE